MAEITAAAVKALRERTGLGMMECKKALTNERRRCGRGGRVAAQAGLEDHGAAQRPRYEFRPHGHLRQLDRTARGHGGAEV